MYFEKLEPILSDLESKEVEIAGGSMVGMTLSMVNSLIIYITNLTIGKKNYEAVQDKVIEIQKNAIENKKKALEIIDKDKEVLEKILLAYKNRKNEPAKYQETCKNATDFCMEVVNLAIDTIKLSNEIAESGNKMLSSDFKICQYYATASLHSAIENVKINVNSIDDTEFKTTINNKCEKYFKNITKFDFT